MHTGEPPSIILLFGGQGSERLVSVASAQNVSGTIAAEPWFWSASGAVFRVSAGALHAHQRPFETEFAPGTAAQWASLPQALADPGVRAQDPVFFLALHGSAGEDGTVQALLAEAGYGYTGSGAQASELAFDKARAKEMVANAGIPIAPSIVTDSADMSRMRSDAERAFGEWGAIVLKPRASGSSDGLSIPASIEALPHELERLAARPPEPYIIERRAFGREITVGVVERAGALMGLPCSEVRTEPGALFDYQGKYLGAGATEITPADIPASRAEEARNLATRAHRALGCRGYSRTDFILAEDGFVFLETNTLPGLTKASFLPAQLAEAGIPFSEFVREQLQLACSN